MIIEPTVTELLNVINDRYKLISLVAQRARELQDGAEKLTSFEHYNKLTIAAHEIVEGLVTLEEKR